VRDLVFRAGFFKWQIVSCSASREKCRAFERFCVEKEDQQQNDQ